jgi:hypothetical protein
MFTTMTATLNASASGTSRRLFYWFSTLVVTLIATVTVLEAFGVYFFPHRSWSEGINPKVIQIRGGALYYRYITVEPSDLRLQLPSGVQPTFLGVLADIRRLDARGKLFLRLMTLPEDLFFLALVWLVRNMVLSAWSGQSGQSGQVTPFIRANVRRLRWIAGLLAALWVYHLFLPSLTGELSFYAGATPNAVNNLGRAVGEDIPWYLTNGYLAVALLLLILAQVFSHGVRLQKDVEGLV